MTMRGEFSMSNPLCPAVEAGKVAAMIVPTVLSDYMQVFLPAIENELRSSVAAESQPDEFNTMLNYHLGFATIDGSSANVYSGKRIRPVLTLLSCEACGGDWMAALPAATGIELLHNFSLIHDDIEDRDELRRGRPTLWARWGEAKAINAGDAMFALAHLAMQRTADRGAAVERVLLALRAFDETCVKLTIGQHLDLSFESRVDVTAPEYMRMIEAKTAALTSAACEIGALLGGGDQEHARALADFGRWLGMSFQLQDDVLGIWGDPSVTGKHDSDLAHGKKTLPALYAADRDQRVRERYFRSGPLSNGDVGHMRSMIEAAGGREHAEQAAANAFNHALAALEKVGLRLPAVQALRDLAHSLLGRSS
jgi:geranylgeranyl diphosphate synthase type I